MCITPPLGSSSRSESHRIHASSVVIGPPTSPSRKLGACARRRTHVSGVDRRADGGSSSPRAHQDNQVVHRELEPRRETLRVDSDSRRDHRQCQDSSPGRQKAVCQQLEVKQRSLRDTSALAHGRQWRCCRSIRRASDGRVVRRQHAGPCPIGVSDVRRSGHVVAVDHAADARGRRVPGPTAAARRARRGAGCRRWDAGVGRGADGRPRGARLRGTRTGCAVAAASYDILVRFLREALRTLAVLGLVIALGAYLAGPPRRRRSRSAPTRP